MTGTRRPEQREALLAGAVEHVLGHGVATLSLRPLATALGTSDRMLLYWFGSRDRLLTAVLDAVGGRLREGLRAVLPDRPVAPGEFVQRVRAVLGDPAAEPALRLYVEVAGLAARGQEPFRTAASEVARSWLEWTGEVLDVADADRAAAAAAVLTVVDGLLLVRFVTDPATADRAADWLADRLG
jgi:AcrR family transcriptional regulator